MALPADGHVHTEWSWDAPGGSMERTCAQAVAIGLPAVAFTEHADFGPWVVLASDLEEHPHLQAFATPEGMLAPPPLDLHGYLESVQRCRDRFPGLRILTGVELGEPHRHGAAVARLLAAGQFDRVLGSLHSLPRRGRFSEMPNLYREQPAADVVREYLDEVVQLIEGSDAFGVLAHIQYAARYWPPQAGPFDPGAFEEKFRHALRVLADGGRALEVNTRGALPAGLVRWWREEGGRAITFGSDAHEPTRLAGHFAETAAMVAAHGFRAGRHPADCWTAAG